MGLQWCGTSVNTWICSSAIYLIWGFQKSLSHDHTTTASRTRLRNPYQLNMWASSDAGHHRTHEFLECKSIWCEDSKGVVPMSTWTLLPTQCWEILAKWPFVLSLTEDISEHFNLFKLDLFDERIPKMFLSWPDDYCFPHNIEKYESNDHLDFHQPKTPVNTFIYSR